jgi:hypothetical protein
VNILGVRCSSSDFSYAVLNGSRASPVVLKVDSLAYPANYARCRPRALQWFVQEVEELIRNHNVEAVIMKRFEGRSRGTSFEERAEYEGAVYVAAARCGLSTVGKKVKSTIAKHLGLKGQAHYLETGLNTSAIPAYSEYTEKEQEAILCAWSQLG